MKKLLALLLALMMVFALASCGGKDTDTPKDDDKQNETAEDNKDKDETEKKEEENAEKCVFCFDMEDNDRKCDECGNWIYEKGEVWTKQVPENLKITVKDYLTNYYVIEKIGDELYIKSYLNENDYNSKATSYDSFITMTTEQNRDFTNGAYGEWRDNGFAIKYGDVYEMFAIKALQYLTGTTLSSRVETCLETASSGTETIAGKECTIKEFDGTFGTKYKVWMWDNLPIKVCQMDTNSETEYKMMYEVLDWDEAITAFTESKPE